MVHRSSNMVSSRREHAEQRKSSPNKNGENRRSSLTRRSRSPNVYRCKLCDRFHALKVCPTFLSMSPKQRNIFVLRETYCANCLARSHRFRDCRSRNMCRICARPHNTLLHPNYINRKPNQSNGKTTKHKTTGSLRRAAYNNSNTGQTTPDNNVAAANQKILSEAIRALASVLC
ncbi:uncharacterized protein LOC131998431 [Stomoxys calcitrans]|uniref:uncharacterized protein LOC131996740 n=1 Tax=Stomoxys calcitrans TaxID=35570 RepID=UPI0027E2BB6E|nr:uncharacterized protein LOC131996740 [Stomoxys calcitrans]XP_059226697.1 uncharacterized protein LOC131998431 [Stomoxys calcitrans]